MALLMKCSGCVVIAYIIIVIGFTVFQRSLMYFPNRSLPSLNALSADGFKVVKHKTADGLMLTSWYHPASKGYHTIVYFQGNGGNIGDRIQKIEPFFRAGYGVFLLGYRGYGGNPGQPSEEGLYKDARSALRYLEIKGVTNNKAVLLGESLGSGVAIKIASERRVGAVILEAPFTSAVEVGQAAYFFLPVDLLMYDRFLSIDIIDQINTPLLIIHGEQDNIIPVKFGRRLFERAKQPKESFFLPYAGHNDLFRYNSTDKEVNYLEGLRNKL